MSKQTTLTDFLSMYKPWDIIYPTAVSVLFKNTVRYGRKDLTV